MVGRGIQFYYKIRTPPKRNKAEEEKHQIKLGKNKNIEQRKQNIIDKVGGFIGHLWKQPRERSGDWPDPLIEIVGL